ncbi:MAG: AAA family ATPase [Planctomycetes bacterium]|nr:AAA family ATPase [Planctomycetota bacterium]
MGCGLGRDGLGPLVRDGRWDELQAQLDARRAQLAEGRIPGPRAWLTLQPGSDGSASSEPSTIAPRVELTDHQARAFEAILAWVRRPERPVLTLGGYAGTGKSTLVGALAAELANRNVAFCAPTGKAALVLREKLIAAGADPSGLRCSTIHRLIYHAKLDQLTGRCLGFERVRELDHDLLVVDEASMVDADLLTDLRSFGVPILAVGDHGQLPPIGEGEGLMASPDLRLTEIHRQAEGNPIIRLSADVRAGAGPMDGVERDPRLRRERVHDDADERALLRTLLHTPADAWSTAILCSTNRARVRRNELVREGLGLPGRLARDDVVLCLRNAYFGEHLLANGARGVVEDVIDDDDEPWHWRARIRHPDDACLVDGFVLREQIAREHTLDAYGALPFEPRSWDEVGLLYDHGYALTVHKAQGSQFRRVVLFLERPGPMDDGSWRRWLYTGITRAVDELVLVERVTPPAPQPTSHLPAGRSPPGSPPPSARDR